MFHVIVKESLIVKHVIQIKNRIKKHGNVNVKFIVNIKISIVGT